MTGNKWRILRSTRPLHTNVAAYIGSDICMDILAPRLYPYSTHSRFAVHRSRLDIPTHLVSASYLIFVHFRWGSRAQRYIPHICPRRAESADRFLGVAHSGGRSTRSVISPGTRGGGGASHLGSSLGAFVQAREVGCFRRRASSRTPAEPLSEINFGLNLKVVTANHCYSRVVFFLHPCYRIRVDAPLVRWPLRLWLWVSGGL